MLFYLILFVLFLFGYFKYPGNIQISALETQLQLPLSIAICALVMMVIFLFHLFCYFSKIKNFFLHIKDKHDIKTHEKELSKTLDALVKFSLDQPFKLEKTSKKLRPFYHYLHPESWDSIQYLMNNPITKPLGWSYAADFHIKNEAFQEAYDYFTKLGKDTSYLRLRIAEQGLKLPKPITTLSPKQKAFEMYLKNENLKDAFKSIPHFIPLALELNEDDYLLKTYETNPHRTLIDKWSEKDPIKRFKTLESITPKNHLEGYYILANEAKNAGLSGEEKYYRDMEKPTGVWICQKCFTHSNKQLIWCPKCYEIDSFEWK